MYSAIGTILHRATRGNRPYNILTSCTHEAYETNLAKTGHMFYAWHGKNIKNWRTDYRPVPSNYVLLDGSNPKTQIPNDVKFDFILSQNKFGQLQVLSKLAQLLHLPIVSLEHTLPQPEWSPDTLQSIKSANGDMNIFISEYSRKTWGWKDNEADVVHHGIDTEVFTDRKAERENHVLCVVNDWVNRDGPCNFQTFQRVVLSGGIPYKVLGDTPGLSLPAKNTEELVEAYQTSRIFLNTSVVSPIPTALLEAMACGCAVVTTATCMIPEIVKDGENGFITNSETTIHARIKELMDNPELAAKLGEKARETIIRMFGLETFVGNWNKVFDRAASIPYRG